MKVTVQVWDLPLRLFHWLLVFSFFAAYATAKLGGAWMDWHGRLGLFILGLLSFRLVWGFIGSHHARFVHFFPTVRRIINYLKGQWQGLGHNPLGALSVLGLLSLLTLQVVSGLFANDDIAFEGPLASLIDKSLSDRSTGWHSLIFNGLLVLVGLHLLAIVYHRLVKKNNLVLPMLSGKKELPRVIAESLELPVKPRFTLLRLVISLSLASGAIWGVSDGIAQVYQTQIQDETPIPAQEAQETASEPAQPYANF